jgi:hypothetical protein
MDLKLIMSSAHTCRLYCIAINCVLALMGIMGENRVYLDEYIKRCVVNSCLQSHIDLVCDVSADPSPT